MMTTVMLATAMAAMIYHYIVAAAAHFLLHHPLLYRMYQPLVTIQSGAVLLLLHCCCCLGLEEFEEVSGYRFHRSQKRTLMAIVPLSRFDNYGCCCCCCCNCGKKGGDDDIPFGKCCLSFLFPSLVGRFAKWRGGLVTVTSPRIQASVRHVLV